MKIGEARGLYNESGIYQIKCLANSKIYIGSSKNIGRRYNGHLRKLSRNVHKNKYMQHSWNKYGQDNFEFSIIEFCDTGCLEEKEKFYFKLTNCCHRDFGFNIVRSPYSGCVSGEEHYLYGKHLSEQTKQKLSQSHKWMKGKNHPGYGKPRSKETIEKMSKSMMGKMFGENHPSSKLSKLDALDIINRRKSGEKLKTIAADYNISETHASRISRGKSWSRIEK